MLAQSESVAHDVLHAVALAQTSPPAQGAAVATTQVLEASQVPAGVKVLPLHEATGQSALVVHCTQPDVGLQAPGHVCGVPAVQAWATQVAAGVKALPLHKAAAH